jgi:prepilin-type N-terminal cleavage/methylation domain-containing protein
MRARFGFTLVELLVVVTIIVVLLAVLAPALSKSVYAAQLVKCATNYRFLANGSWNYAQDNKKRYPFRDLPLPPEGTDWPLGVQAHKLTHPTTGSGDVRGYDLRPMLRPYVKIDDVFNDPLCVPLNYDNRDAAATTTSIYTSIFYWAGWYYYDRTSGSYMRGMFKVGDRFDAYDEHDTAPRRILSLDVIAGDIDCTSGGTGWNSHPDFATNYNRVYEGAEWIESNWIGRPQRAPVDLNFAYQDGSVLRVDKVVWYDRNGPANRPKNDPRMVRIANFNAQANGDGQRNNVPLN